ncbi:hypothetical protein FNF27_07427 [Cafeteria roenbergensis]|uniref:Uncharacterized protein n=1 Tax=Cafeteria roenbergensis TaxID=33653 RepID=A0A5A8DNG2_CAFRO|nr:hypothetical protein FNF27_07427 [Cafeteria roenbergensis]
MAPGITLADDAATMVDIARLCSLPWANASRGGACEEDFRILTERFSDRFAPAAWPQLVAPGSALAAQAPTAHASGRRGMPGLPMSQSLVTSMRWSDAPRPGTSAATLFDADFHNRTGATTPTRQGATDPRLGHRTFLGRPHQMLIVFAAGLDQWGALRIPGLPPPAPVDQGLSASLLLGHSTWNATSMLPAARVMSASALFWDGDGTGNGCRITGDAATGSIRPPWQAFREVDMSYAESVSMCFGGHASECSIRGGACGAAAAPKLSPVPRSDAEASCLPSEVIGSEMQEQPPQKPDPWWQWGSLSSVAWFKPCAPEACGGRPCSAEECRSNTADVVQRRAVQPARVPSPALLGVLRLADGGAFDCRAWLGAWSGQWSADGSELGCEAGWPMLTAAASEGRLRVASSDGVLGVAGHLGQHDGGGWVAAALLSPLLSGAEVRVQLDVPLNALVGVSRQQLLAGVVGEALVAAGGRSNGCVRAVCRECPGAENRSVWGWAGPVRPEGVGGTSPAVRLIVGVTFMRAGDAECGTATAPSSLGAWLVDARALGRAHPVAFTGEGSNLSWASDHAEARRLGGWLEQVGPSLPELSPAVLALSLAASVSGSSPDRLLGRWLVWAAPQSQPPEPRVTAVVAGLPAAGLSPWSPQLCSGGLGVDWAQGTCWGSRVTMSLLGVGCASCWPDASRWCWR